MPGAPHEAGAQRGQRDGVAGAQAALALGALQRERDRRAAGVGAAVDVEHDLLGGHVQLGGGRLDDARVGLVGDEQVDVVDGHARRRPAPRRSRRPSARRRGGRPSGPPCADCAIVDLGVQRRRPSRRRCRGRSGRCRPPARRRRPPPRRRPSPNRIAVPRSAWSVTRDSASAAHSSTTCERPDSTARGGVVQADAEAGAGGVEVERDGRLRGADQPGDHRREARRQAVGRDRGDDDAVDLGGVAAGVGQRADAGLGGQRRQRLVGAPASGACGCRCA